ncbi:hypothetical protein [Spirulina sp. 06S082]|uniref:hypothetical protein n=1 Tax=Spirulina sp. 06S082 TaxID=3110248 RepID=UPI002B1EAC24|nr:hypothetical protein [Spirulina sp. 06S082]MEA5471353.1 hypothetical protein [Spirulina sp. 06S082]
MKAIHQIGLSSLTAIAILLGSAVNSPVAQGQWVADITPHNRNVKANSSISGTFQTQGEAAIDVNSVRIFLNGRDITANSTINRSFFSYRPSQPLNSGEHIVRVQFKNQEGLSNEVSWSFFVPGTSTTVTTPTTTTPNTTTPNTTTPTAATVLPLNFLNHKDGEAIATRGFVLQGETEPGAKVTVKVVSSSPSVFGVINLGGDTTLVDRPVMVDENGRFQVEVPRPSILQRGIRYNIEAAATSPDGRSHITTMTLIQE